MNVLGTATDVLIYTGALVAYGFLARFAMTTWKDTLAGRIAMAVAVVGGLILTLAVLGTATGQDYPGREWVRFGTYLFIDILLMVSLFTLVRDQRRTRRKEAHRGTLESC